MSEQQQQQENTLPENLKMEGMTLTTNGQLAYAPGYFLKDEEQSISAFNIAITKKDDFQNAKQYLDKIFDGKNKILKVYAMILMVHIRDIDQGKGLRKPFLEGLVYLYKKGYKQFVVDLVSEIPEYGYFKDLCNLFKLGDCRKYTDLTKEITSVYIKALEKEHESKDGRNLNNSGKFAPRQQKKFHSFFLALSNTMFPDSKSAQKEYRKYISEIMGKYKQITEILMSVKQWDQIDPKYVPSLCFQKYKKCFLNTETDDEKRKALKEKYDEHIKNALEGKKGAKVNAKRLTIDKLIAEFYKNIYAQTITDPEIEQNAREAQMIDIINDLKKNAKFLKNCVAVCDVSGSMGGDPMNACIGLGIALHELNSGKYSHSILTFSADPIWVDLGDGMTYQEKVKAVATAQWGMNTDFFKAMKKVAELEELPQAMFVFSDMQFECAGGSGWNTTYDEIKSYYIKKGYTEAQIPTIVFWNLRGGANNFAVDSHQKKVICISGFSQNLLKAIVQAPDMDYIMNLTPFTFLVDVLDGKRYEKVKKIALKNVQN